MEVADVRHMLRRLTFAATPSAERALRPLSPDAAVATLFAAARRTASPPPDVVRGTWTNAALRLPGMSATQADAARSAQIDAARQQIEQLRQWWLAEMLESTAPLRENLVLFLHGIFGTATATVDVPHALYEYNARLRRGCVGTFPALLEDLVLDPAMMIQIGMDEHGKERVSDRPAKLILDNWTVGAGEYADADVEELSRALTGWTLTAPAGQQPAVTPDPQAPRAMRRTGLVPAFDPKQFDAGAKTILGRTAAFDARSAIAWLARHPATARQFSRRLVQHLGIEDPRGALVEQLASTYAASDGSIDAMVRTAVASREWTSDDSRWSLIKSPVHLAVGACRQLEIAAPPLAEISRWLTASGQVLFDLPAGGEGRWPGQEAWVTPPDRLAIRYQLPLVLSGHRPPLGLAARPHDAGRTQPVALTSGSLRTASIDMLIDRLDPAPGLDSRAIAREVEGMKGDERTNEAVRRVMMTPQYQMA